MRQRSGRGAARVFLKRGRANAEKSRMTRKRETPHQRVTPSESQNIDFLKDIDGSMLVAEVCWQLLISPVTTVSSRGQT